MNSGRLVQTLDVRIVLLGADLDHGRVRAGRPELHRALDLTTRSQSPIICGCLSIIVATPEKVIIKSNPEVDGTHGPLDRQVLASLGNAVPVARVRVRVLRLTGIVVVRGPFDPTFDRLRSVDYSVIIL